MRSPSLLVRRSNCRTRVHPPTPFALPSPPSLPPFFGRTEEEEKAKIQNDLRILTERLSRINDSLSRNIATRNEYDRTIQETEAAYNKILEGSETLLQVLKREMGHLSKKKAGSTSGAGGGGY